ncbi:hypothetical protein [Lentzea flava]|uniref:Uncharacterized protein n=1 Tax=Lentzea flava TaxID=103732 RepID=A0ABQ2UDJ9_9PSEU|nr:hypothetical protein [Lentzea flava]MCP2198013.1 hypothetical protein [Lentzea flava]GGU24046.1 hypothetical protein GCM10010178_15320 [Lentzea flava]
MTHRVALVVAALAAAALVVAPGPVRAPGRPAVAPAVTDAWPGARISTVPGNLPGGAVFAPLSPDLRAGESGGRLVVDGSVVREGPAQYALAATSLVWLERGTGLFRMADSVAELITADIGNVVVLESQYDVVVHDDHVSWAAAGPEGSTEIRTVALTGGAVETVVLQGKLALTEWPYATSAEIEQGGPSTLVDVRTAARTVVHGQSFELIDCTPSWCRVQVLRQGGSARLDLMRPDGTERRRVGGSGLRPAVPDVLLLDRFAVLVDDSRGALCLYDVDRGQLADLASSFGTVVARGNAVWWSTGDNTALTWHTIDVGEL